MFEFQTEIIVVQVVTLNGFQSILIKTCKKFAQNIYFSATIFCHNADFLYEMKMLCPPIEKFFKNASIFLVTAFPCDSRKPATEIVFLVRSGVYFKEVHLK